MTYKSSFILFILICTQLSLSAQSTKQKELENRRLELQKEIKQINKLLFSNQKTKKSVITAIEDLNYKVKVRKDLIAITTKQSDLLTKDINSNQKEITNLSNQLTTLKKDYADMVVKSYKNKSKQSRMMFLLSSENFKQAYKRSQYLKQYANYQKKQGEIIKTKTETLKKLNNKLLIQKKNKQKLIEENILAQNQLEEELKEQQKLVATIKKNLKKYGRQVKAKQREADKIDREIERLVKEAIARSNKAAGKSTASKTYSLTAEDKVLADNFVSNKGKLPWPVERGLVKIRYGKQPSSIDKTVTIQSNGVRIATEKNAKVRAVFEGVVSSIISNKNMNPTVLIRHGDYFTIYKNLSKLYVKKGDKVSTKQDIGEVFTNKNSGETVLTFAVYRNNKFQNPSKWIFKM